MYVGAFIISALVGPLTSGSGTASPSNAHDAPLSAEPIACVAVHIGEKLHYGPALPARADRDATGVLLGELSRLLRAHGYSIYASNGQAALTPEFGISGPNPQCKTSTPFRVRVTYDEINGSGKFRAALFLSGNGTSVISEHNDFDFRGLPQAQEVNPLQYYLNEDLRSKASQILDALLKSVD